MKATNFDRIKSMSVDELASFLAEGSKTYGGIITMADAYICRKCKKENGGRCPTPDDSDCMFNEDDTATIKRWLEGEAEEMELNREHIIKALECCGADDGCVGEECPYYANCHFCITRIAKDALSIIKELTEENERLKSEVSVKRKLLDKAEVRIECVEEENNQLKADICNAEMNLGHITEDNQAKDETITNLIATIKDIQADTVRKMQERLKQAVTDIPWCEYLPVHNCIDQIAEEILEEVTANGDKKD